MSWLALRLDDRSKPAKGKKARKAKSANRLTLNEL